MKEGMPSGASPSLGSWLSFGVPWAYPRLGSFHSLFHSPSNPYPKLENFTTQNLTENSRAPLAKENKTPLQGTVMNSLFIYIGVRPTVFQLLYGL